MSRPNPSSGTDHRGRPRVVVTGMGVKAPGGLTVDELWTSLLAARSMAAPVTLFDPTELSVRIDCEVPEFDPTDYVNAKEARRTDRVSLLGIGASSDAVAAATACGPLGADPVRCGVVAGSGIGGIRTLEEQIVTYAHKGAGKVGPFLVPMMMANATAALIGIRNGFSGPNAAVATACATGANAIGEATRLIRDGTVDVAVCGGAESCITPVTMAAFARMGALSRNEDPSTASRPFDDDRDGFVMGEGAGFLVLERHDHAVARGAPVLGEVAGYAMTCDAHHITAPLEDGSGAQAAIELALADAGLPPSAVGHVNAHGTSTPLNDSAEAVAIAKVFGPGAVPVTSTKGVTGHLIGAAGAVEAVASLVAADKGVVPPTANHRHSDLPVDVVSGAPRSIGRAPVVSTSFAFGGHNVALVLLPA